MNHIYKALVTVLVAGGVFGVAQFLAPTPDFSSSIVVGLIAAVIIATILYLDLIFKTSLNAEAIALTGLGAVVGLFAGALASGAFMNAAGTAELGLSRASIITLFNAISIVFFGYVGYLFSRSPGLRIFGGGLPAKKEGGEGGSAKLLDTSVIIDGRILDIAETRFIEGPLIIPNFVLREIQLISDSPDPIKRNRGRRGLDMLNKLQQRPDIKVQISYLDYTDTREVDAKLIKASLETGAKLITNDFNLNKVAELQGVEVLNLNSLTNALKPVVLPGEDILIDIIKEGKDENQGIGYLEDGTMVVVENGGQLLGKAVKVNVTSIIQTAAGKMIFTRAHGSSDDDSRDSGDNNQNRNEGGRRRRRRGGGGNQNNSNGNDSENRGRDENDREAVSGSGGRRRR